MLMLFFLRRFGVKQKVCMVAQNVDMPCLKAVEPMGECRPVFQVLRDFAIRSGVDPKLVSYTSPREIWDEWRTLSKGSPYDFKARCVGCGQCAQVCNSDCVLLESDSTIAVDTPRIKHQKSPYFLCMKCSAICPTDALNNVSMHEANMGKAKIDLQKCLYHQENSGIMCWTCYERCPLKEKQ